MSSSWSKPCLNCLELPDRTGLLLLHLDCELVQPREESSLPAPERPWRPPKHLSPGNVGVGGRSLPSFVFLRLFSNRDRLWQAVASEDMISLWGGGFCLQTLLRFPLAPRHTELAWLGLCWGLKGDIRHGRGNARAAARYSLLVHLGAGGTGREGCWVFGGCWALCCFQDPKCRRTAVRSAGGWLVGQAGERGLSEGLPPEPEVCLACKQLAPNPFLVML